MSIIHTLQTTLISHTLEQALGLEGWTLGEFSFPETKVVDAVALAGHATKDGERADLFSAWVDGENDGEEIVITMTDSGGKPFTIVHSIVIACVGHVIGAEPRTRPAWATMANAITSVVNFEKGRQRFPIHMIYAYAEVVGMEIHDVLPSLSEILDAEKTPAATVRIGDHEHEVPGEAAAEFIRAVLSERSP